MIFVRYQDFRPGFALGGASIDVDGFPVWPVAKLRSGGFDGFQFDDPHHVNLYTDPMNITVNGFAADAVAGVDEFDWYVSQRTDVIANQYFVVSAYSANHSGSIKLTANLPNTTKLLPVATAANDYTDDDSVSLLFRNVAIYVQRRSDKAYQWLVGM